MKVMLTLFHHSLPQWAAAYGGWKDSKTKKYFLDFTRLASNALVQNHSSFQLLLLAVSSYGYFPSRVPSLLLLSIFN